VLGLKGVSDLALFLKGNRTNGYRAVIYLFCIGFSIPGWS
jgi:hypothetical protein